VLIIYPAISRTNSFPPKFPVVSPQRNTRGKLMPAAFAAVYLVNGLLRG
jgi:hypothetical protein